MPEPGCHITERGGSRPDAREHQSTEMVEISVANLIQIHIITLYRQSPMAIVEVGSEIVLPTTSLLNKLGTDVTNNESERDLRVQQDKTRPNILLVPRYCWSDPQTVLQ